VKGERVMTNDTSGEAFTRAPAHLFTRSPFRILIWAAIVILVFVLAFLPLPTLALLVFYTLILALPLLDPIFGLYWALLSVPVQEFVHLPGGLSYTQAAMALAVGAWALRALAHPERRLVGGRLLMLWAVFLWALLLAVAFSPYSRADGIKETLRWFEAFLVWLMVVNLARRPWQIAGLIACLLLAPAAEAMIGLAQFISGAGPPSFRISPNLLFVRAYGTIGQPNSFAGYLNMAWPLALALAVGALSALRSPLSDVGTLSLSKTGRPRANQKSKIISALGFCFIAAILLAGLVASLSRGAWVGALVGALGMALALGRRARGWVVAAVGLGALALGGVGLLPAFLAQRLSSFTRYLTLFDAAAVTVTSENFAIVERMAQMQAGWRMFLAHPLTGVGPGNYTPAYPAFAIGTWYASRGHAHNYYIHMAAETGIVGTLAYLALLAGVAYQAVVTLRSVDSTFWRSVAIGCCGIIAAVAGHDLFENLHVLSMGIQLAAVWGLLVVLGDRERVNG
jgi:O-antigen ligase